MVNKQRAASSLTNTATSLAVELLELHPVVDRDVDRCDGDRNLAGGERGVPVHALQDVRRDKGRAVCVTPVRDVAGAMFVTAVTLAIGTFRFLTVACQYGRLCCGT